MTAGKAILLGLFAGFVIVVFAALAIIASPLWMPQISEPAEATPVVSGRAYPGNPDQEARLVRAEDERLVYVRTVASAARWRVEDLEGPYRLRTSPTLTLVLPARAQPYTMVDLLSLAPDTLVRQPDGAYLLSENIVVLGGATLNLESAEGLTLRMQSQAESFVSIVTFGGSLKIAGTPEHPFAIQSWDSGAGTVDTATADGRAYLRVIGGNASVQNASLSSLGFWSGDTGGLALTGTHPVTGFEAADDAAEVPSVAGARLLPSGQLSTGADQVAPDYGYVSAAIDNVTVTGNTFGIFVSDAKGVTVRDTRISGSLVNGLVFHRFVTESVVSTTVSADNAIDGFTVDRSSQNVVFDAITAEGNGRDGVSLDGQPLALGPNARGTAVDLYGDNRITNSTLRDNARYGVEISGGRNVEVSKSRISGNETGIVVNHGTAGVAISDNVLTDQVKHAISIRDTVTNAEVRWNEISGGDTGINVRNAGALVQSNRIAEVSNHGVSLVGKVAEVTVSGNTIGGFGAIAVWNEEATGGIVALNDFSTWRPATTFEGVVRTIFQPLTVVWLLLGLLLLGTALTRRGPQFGAFRNPYAEHVPLTSLTRGVVPRDSLPRDTLTTNVTNGGS